ncbi:MAG: hypothetical protein ACR2ND_14830 [Solirubrobacteraceae bacterium]
MNATSPPPLLASPVGVRARPASLRGGRALAGGASLALLVGFAAWIAVGSADGFYLNQLPGGLNPSWSEGPFRGLVTLVGGLRASGFSVAAAGMLVAYGLGLWLAPAISPRVAAAAIVLATACFALAPSLVSTDVFGYIAYARLGAVHHINPYLNAPIAAPHDSILPFVYWRHASTPYGPLFTFGTYSLGSASVAFAFWSLKAVAAASAIALTWVVARTAAARGLDPVRAALLVGLNPVLLLYAVSGAHNDLLATLLIVGGVALAGRGSGAMLVVCGAAVKLTAGLALPFLLLGAQPGRRRSALLGAGLALAFLGGASVALFGLHFADQLWRITHDPTFDTVWSGPDRLSSLLGVGIGSGVRAASTAGALAASLFALWRVRRGADWIEAAGWATLALVASIASLAPWYVVWVLPLAALSRGRALRVAVLALTAYLLCVHLPVLGGVPWLANPHA